MESTDYHKHGHAGTVSSAVPAEQKPRCVVAKREARHGVKVSADRNTPAAFERMLRAFFYFMGIQNSLQISVC